MIYSPFFVLKKGDGAMSLKDRYSKILKKAKVFVILAEKDIMFLPTGPFDRGEHWYTLGEGSLFDFLFRVL